MHYHPPIEDLERLYIEENLPVDAIALMFKVPNYVISYLLRKNHIIKDPKAYRERESRKTFRRIVGMGFSEEKLKWVYEEKQMSIKAIALFYNISTIYLSNLMEDFGIEKRTASEALHLSNKEKKKRIALLKMKNKTEFNKKIESVKKIVKNGTITPSEVCKLISCDIGIEHLKKLCTPFGYDFEILSKTYKNIERILFNLNLYPKTPIKIAVALYFQYQMNQTRACQICGTTDSSFRKYYKIILKHYPIMVKMGLPDQYYEDILREPAINLEKRLPDPNPKLTKYMKWKSNQPNPRKNDNKGGRPKRFLDPRSTIPRSVILKDFKELQ